MRLSFAEQGALASIVPAFDKIEHLDLMVLVERLASIANPLRPVMVLLNTR